MPVRAPSVFEAMLNETDPLPLPDAPLEIVIHGAFDVAVQAHPVVVVTAVDPLPPVESTDWLAGAIE